VAAVNPLKTLSPDDLKFKTWAVLVAGSFGWDNYRHQADICHAYHALHSLGIPEDHIIVMMTDDIAYHKKNPFPGKIFNDDNNVMIDYYEGVPHDYTGELVSADVFTRILTGEDMDVGSGKSLKSGPDDNVFVFYDDHGDYDKLIFPDRCLGSNEIQAIIDKMTQKNMYKRLIIYDEACLSGSLFYKINYPDNVYVTTAAPVGTFSFGGCGNLKIGMGVCDAYSHSWITDLEKNHKDGYSFSQQFDVIQEALRDEQASQSCWYGSKDIFDMPIADFFEPSFTVPEKNESTVKKHSRFVSNVDFELEVAKNAFINTPTDETLANLNKQIAIRKAIDSMTVAIVSAAKPDVPYLASVPCAVCSVEGCECVKTCTTTAGSQCYGKPDVLDCCKYECCNEESCFNDPTFINSDIKRRDACVTTLSHAFSEACGSSHPYLLTANLLFMRVCKQQDIDIESALDEIRDQCSKFDINSF